MRSDAALDDLAFHVALQLMGSDQRRRLRVALARDPALEGEPGFNVKRAERLLLLAEGSLEPITLQDRMDLARIERERHAPTFSASFWALRHSDLVNAGFNAKVASTLIADIRSRVETEEGAEPCLA